MIDLAGSSSLLIVLSIVQLGEGVHVGGIVGGQEHPELGGDRLQGVAARGALGQRDGIDEAGGGQGGGRDADAGHAAEEVLGHGEDVGLADARGRHQHEVEVRVED